MSLYTKEDHCWAIQIPFSEQANFFSAIKKGCHFHITKPVITDYLLQICDGWSSVRLRSYNLTVKGTEYIYYHVTNDDRRKIIKYLEMYNLGFILS